MANRSDHSLLAAGADLDLPADRSLGDARTLSDVGSGVANVPARVALLNRAPRRSCALRRRGSRLLSRSRSCRRFHLRVGADDAQPDGHHIVFALSYNMLLGETGLLSFGHAVYYGLGGFLVVHAMNTVIHDRLSVPLPVIPLVGGFSGLLFGIIFGSVSTRRAGTAFAMISLGLGELVASSSLILRGFFGGEEGVAPTAPSCCTCSVLISAANPGLLSDRGVVPSDR